jgi:hypothetical protein
MNTLQQLINNYPDKLWNWYTISKNNNIDEKFILNNINNKNFYWDWVGISLNLHITENLIIQHLDKNWDWKFINLNININDKFIKSHCNIVLDSWPRCKSFMHLNYIPDFLKINFNIIESKIQTSFKYFPLPKYSITNDYIKKKKDNNKYDWYIISKNINNFNIVTNNLNKPWDWKELSKNLHISIFIIKNNINLPWDWNEISLNPNITYDFIKNNINKNWDWKNISKNQLKYNLRLQYFKLIQIQKNFRILKFFKFIKNCSLKNKLKNELIYLPNIGIEYFKCLNDFNKSKINKKI